ncbi:MAG: 50S ribosomal protein L10 [Patescibacteria group bacterium]
MPKTKQQKKEILNQLAENLEKQSAMVFVDYKGLKVGDMITLRKQLKETGSELMISKKTLFSKAMKEKGIEVDFKNMEGQIGTIFAFEDPMIPIKTANTFAKANEKLKILGGYFERELQNAASIVTLANLPSREELLAKLLYTMTAPLSDFAIVLQGNIKGLIYVLAQKAKT